MDKINLMGVNISNITSTELSNEVVQIVKNGQKEMVLAVNIHTMNLICKNPWLKLIYNKSYHVHCDGDGIRLGAWILGKKIKEKLLFNQWIWDLAKISEQNLLSWYLIGSRKETIDKAVKKLLMLYPKLNIIGYRGGFFVDQKDVDITINDIQLKKPNLIILGMGQPLQEKWIADYFNRLQFNVCFGAGAIFEYISGNAKMTPAIFKKLKLEWFYRFIHDPKRLFRRYFIGNPLFLIRILMIRIGVKSY